MHQTLFYWLKILKVDFKQCKMLMIWTQENVIHSMSGCIEREMSKIILTLPSKYEHYEIFEQTVIGGFSSVNTRLAFGSEILLPNLIKQNVEIRKNLN